MRLALFTLILAVAALSTIPATLAYTTTESVRSNSEGTMVFIMGTNSADLCTHYDPGSHLAMATSAEIQSKIFETAKNGGVTSLIPMGGGTMQATCVGLPCEWRWWRGFYFYIWPIFYRGVYYTGPHSSKAANPEAKTQAVLNSYANWDTNFPISWANLSYWGKRVVAMQPSNGKWRNVEIATKFPQLVCEHYIYRNSDGVAGITPTFPDGSPITLVSSSGHVYSFCGKKVTKDINGRWILQKCGGKFPWWAGLVIACGCYVIVVALIILIWCCCCARKRKEEENHRREVIATERDNTSHIPTQSELGLGRNSSLWYQPSDSPTESRSTLSSSSRCSSQTSSSSSSHSFSSCDSNARYEMM